MFGFCSAASWYARLCAGISAGPTFKFKQHEVDDATLLWLKELRAAVERNEKLDLRIAWVRRGR